MHLFIFLHLLFILTNNNPSYVRGKGYEGYIFDENHFVMLSVPNQKVDILLQKKILKLPKNY
ncbi:MAG TPA: hypothetical protein PK995_05885 [Bacteroidia bacterium]|nr:hypothetical protein [Bacteroidia bacterium]